MSMPTQAPPSRGRQDGPPAAHPGELPAIRTQDSLLDPTLRQTLRDAMLHELSPLERLLVVLWYVEQMSPAEIGATLDMTELQVTRSHRLVLAKLRRHTPA